MVTVQILTTCCTLSERQIENAVSHNERSLEMFIGKLVQQPEIDARKEAQERHGLRKAREMRDSTE